MNREASEGIGRLETADIALGARLAGARDHPAIRAAGVAGEIGSWQALLALSSGTLAVGLLTGNRRLARAGGHMLGAGILASLAKTSVKRLVHRTRPHVMMETGVYASGPFGTRMGPLQSFPSGHSALSVAVACALARTYPELRGPAYAAAAGVGVVQMLRGSHYPADVIAGSLIGVAAEAAVARVTGRDEPAA